MENRVEFADKTRNRGEAKVMNENESHRFQRDYLSPKLLRRKPEKKPKRDLKIKTDTTQQVCYISPRKTLQHMFGGSQSTTSLVSLIGSPRSIVSNDIDQKNLYDWEDQHTDSLCGTSQQQADNRQFKKNSLLQEGTLRKQLKELIGKNQRLQEENMYCLSKIQQLSLLLTEKNQKIRKLEENIYQKDKDNENLNKKLQQQSKYINQLEETIWSYNKNQNQKISTISISEDTDDGEKSMTLIDLQTQIEMYKRTNIELGEKLKYYDIQQRMYKKLMHDYEEELKRNQKLRNLNQRMMRKIEGADQKKKILKPRSRDLTISFQLSPDK